MKTVLVIALLGWTAVWAQAQTQGPSPITRIAEIRALTREQAAQARPARVRGVVNLAFGSHAAFILADDSAGIYVSGNEGGNLSMKVFENGKAVASDAIKLGLEVEVEGMTSPGGYAPVILATEVRILGQLPLSPPQRVSLDHLQEGGEDAQRVQLDSLVVRSVLENQPGIGRRVLRACSASGHYILIVVEPAPWNESAKLVDAEVMVTGIVLPLFNSRLELTGLRLAVAREEDFEIVKPPPPDVWATPRLEPGRLRLFRPTGISAHRCTVEGTVTLIEEDGLVIQDQGRGVAVKNTPSSGLQVGDRVRIADQAFNGALTHFYRWAGRGLNPYGNNKPERGFVDNGKNGNLAFVMAAAAALTPNGEKSVYAGARDVAAANGFYSTSFMLHGHTGGGIGEIWRSASMGLLHDKKPNHYRDFMDQRRWHYELSRRFDGSFGILDGSPNYDNLEWGAAYPLAYTIPRKTLRISGSPPTKFSKQYQLPERPWGTKADDAFLSLEPAAYSNGTIPDFSKETVAMDSGKPALAMLTKSDVSDDTLLKYCHHPDSEIRRIAASKIMGVNLSYLAKPEGPGGEIRTKLANELLRSKDPRVRRSMLDGIATGLSGDKLVGFLGSDGIALLVGMLKDPDESWWVIDGVLSLLASAPPDTIAPHVDVILPFLKHKEWWLQNAALSALVPVATDARCYKKVLEPMGEMMTTCQVYNATSALSWTLMPKLKEASPEVQSLAMKAFQGAFSGFTGVKTAPGGQNITVTYDSQLDFLASSLVSVPGGADVLFKLAKERFPEQSLPYSKLILSADSTKFGPELKAAIGPIIREKLIKEYIAKNRLAISNGIDNPTQRGSVTNSMDGLVELYHKIGIRDYDWKVFGPDLINAKWHYFTFDPPEEQKYDLSPWRYRPVTYPKGMENWFASDFDPAKSGWKSGQFPIGQFNGKLAANRTPETRPDNIWPTMPRTLWEKEVLLVSGTFDLPAPKPGHIHRLRIQTGQGVGAGDGFKVFINGKPLAEAKEGLGRGGGDTIRGAWITREVANDFGKGPVTIAATSFLRYGDRAIVQMPPIPQGIFSMWLEEMKIPPME